MQDGTNQAEKTGAMHAELKATQQHTAELQSQLLEQQQRNDSLQREADLARIQLQESREAFRVRIQHCMLEVRLQPHQALPHCTIAVQLN